MVFSDDSPPPFPPLLPYISIPLSFWRLSPGLTSCTYSLLSTRVPKLSCRASYHQKWSCKCTMHVVPCPRHPLSSALFSFYFVLLHGVWWAWDGSLLFFFSVATTTITHPQSVWGYYYLLPHPSSTLTSRCSSDGAQCRGCTLSSYPICLALWVAWHHGGHHRGIRRLGGRVRIYG